MTKSRQRSLRRSMRRAAIDAVKNLLVPEDPKYISDEWDDPGVKMPWIGPEVNEIGHQEFCSIAEAIRALPWPDE